MLSNSVSYFMHRFQHRYRQRSKLPSFIHFICFFEKQAAIRSTAISWLILHKLFLLQLCLLFNRKDIDEIATPWGMISLWYGKSQEL